MPRHTHPTILVVVSHSGLRTRLADALRQDGCKVLCAADIASADSIVTKNRSRVDLVAGDPVFVDGDAVSLAFALGLRGHSPLVLCFHTDSDLIESLSTFHIRRLCHPDLDE